MEPKLQFNNLPLVSKVAFWGIVTSFALQAFLKLLFFLIDLAVPAFDPLDQFWFFPLLIVIWLPFLVALMCGYFVVIRYPYQSQAIKLQEPLIENRDSPVWILLGLMLMLVGSMMGLAAFDADSVYLLVAMVYIGMTLIFAGYCLAYFEREKNVVIATFLDVTLRFGIVLAPLYFPALIIGAVNYRRFQRSIPK